MWPSQNIWTLKPTTTTGNSLYFCEMIFFPQRFPQWLLLLVSFVYSEKTLYVDKLRPVRGLHSCFFCCFWHLNYLGRAWTNTWQNSEGEKIKHSLGLGEILVCPWRRCRFALDPYSFYCHTYMFYVGLKYTNNNSEVGSFSVSFSGGLGK